MAGSGNVLKPKKQEPELEVEEAPEEEIAPVREKKQKLKKRAFDTLKNKSKTFNSLLNKTISII